ncbi:hypothetical protein CC80DRAFT_509048 [Byssothecium circinans]|uniref:Uncharacterized protein n=1 Tax=Byssothecium circinans TaxID=147558 RepID=A0A6A5TF13_9PLEO|nr:hypothetical protein CC80DRAFT_509048 [Byssothecium circinans]
MDSTKSSRGFFWTQTITDGSRIRALRFYFVDKFNVNGLRRYANGDPEYEKTNIDTISRCLKVVISKSFDPSRVRQQSSNKFFVKSARYPLRFPGPSHSAPASHSIEIIRSYYYVVKEGMGNILLNFNLCTSAFYRPIFVNGGGKKVYKVHDLSTHNIETLTFRKRILNPDGKSVKNSEGKFKVQDDDSYAVGHLEEPFEFEPVRGRPAVKVGTSQNAIWYSQEKLRILPYQIYRRPVPVRPTASMVNQAAKPPG